MMLVRGQRMDVWLNPERVAAIKKASPSRYPSKALVITDAGYEYYSTATVEVLIKEWGECRNESFD